MKKILSIFIAIFLVTIAFSSFTEARKGVGLKILSVGEIVNEGEEVCVQYGLYNPWDEDVYASLKVSNELADVVSNIEAENKLIPGYTSSAEAIPTKLCFEVGEIYEKDCLIGDNYLCEKRCPTNLETYNGEVTLVQVKDDSMEGMGSATALGITSGLRLRVMCNGYKRDWTPVYIIVIVAILVILAILLYIRYSVPETPKNRKKSRKKKR